MTAELCELFPSIPLRHELAIGSLQRGPLPVYSKFLVAFLFVSPTLELSLLKKLISLLFAMMLRLNSRVIQNVRATFLTPFVSVTEINITRQILSGVFSNDVVQEHSTPRRCHVRVSTSRHREGSWRG